MSANPSAGAQPASDVKARFEAERSGQPFLVYPDSGGRQRIFYLDPGVARVSVGRQPSADLVLDWDEQVSRLHAGFEWVDGAWTVVDDGSRNGTFVNGQRLSARSRLSDGDSVRVGATTMTFRSPAVDLEGGAAVGPEMPAVELSSTQRRVLAALCGPYRDGNMFATPAKTPGSFITRAEIT